MYWDVVAHVIETNPSMGKGTKRAVLSYVASVGGMCHVHIVIHLDRSHFGNLLFRKLKRLEWRQHLKILTVIWESKRVGNATVAISLLIFKVAWLL